MLSCAVFAKAVRATELAILLMFVVLTDAVAFAEFATCFNLTVFANTCALTLYAFTLFLTMLTLDSFAVCLAFGAGLAAPSLINSKLINGMTESVAAQAYEVFFGVHGLSLVVSLCIYHVFL